MLFRASILIGLIAIMACTSCRMVEVLAGGEKAGTVDRLWSDVPPLDDAKKADLAIPLAARLAIRAAMQGKVNFIAFTSGRSAAEIRNFYSNERMKAAGWTPGDAGCVGDTESNDGEGAVCFFARKTGTLEEGLAIIVAEDRDTKQTHLFYARIDITPEKQTRGAADGSSKQ